MLQLLSSAISMHRASFCFLPAESSCLSENGRYVTSSSNTAYCVFREVFEQTWFEARDSCLNLGGDLAVFPSQSEFSAASTMLHTLSDSERADTYWIGFMAHEWTWATGDYMTYSNWATDYPQNVMTGPKCISMNRYMMWEDQDCSQSQGFACQFGRLHPLV